MDARKRKRIERLSKELLLESDLYKPGFDIYALLKEKKIEYQFADLGEKIYGASRVDESPLILINQTNHPNRQRFSAAHELGHILLHQEVSLNYSDRLLYRSDNSSEGSDWREIEANYFAACLLMSQELVEQSIEMLGVDLDESDIEALADSFKVSSIAMSIRLSALGYI